MIALCTYCVSGGKFRRRKDSLAKAATIQMAPSTHKDPQITTTSAHYYAIADRPSSSQNPELYYDLHLNDQPTYDYIDN